MARPNGRAFLRPLGAGSPRGGALRGSSALAPDLGLVAASVWARPFGRAVNGPGLGPALPTRRPRGLVLLTARQGMPALRAGGGSRPRPLGASLPPPAACGPLPLPTLGGLGAARPARLRRSGLCGGWSPPTAAQVCALRACQPPAVARGHLPAPQGQAPCGGRFAGLAPLLPLAGRGVGAPARPGPPLCGGCGAVRASGPVGPGSGQPPRAGPPAALPALVRLCLR